MNIPKSGNFASDYRVRGYGQGVIDLDVAFGDGRAEAVTALLDCCVCDQNGVPCGAEAIWDWTIGERLQALLAVRLASSNDATLDVQARCLYCGEGMDISLDLRAFVRAAPTPSFSWRSTEGRNIELRLPRGSELRSWQYWGLPEPGELIATLKVKDVDEPRLTTDDMLADIEIAFAQHDPLSALHLEASCPECGRVNEIDCDLEALLLGGFARMQMRLIDEVAQLATRFHWSEAQILALPPWRRSEYLRRLDAGAWM